MARLKSRNGFNYKEAMLRIDSQMPLQRKAELADEIIVNRSSILELHQNIEKVLERNPPSFLRHIILYWLMPLSIILFYHLLK